MKKVLILDDDLAVLEALEETLKYGEYEVTAISATGDILKEIEGCNPDVIILDYLLQGTNGGIWCQRIKEEPRMRHIPVIITSAYPKDLKLKATEYGFDDFLPKPFDIDELLNLVAKHAHVKAALK